ncbi:MAG: hypothetical protein NTZ05_07535 [Chloroflexi bacterium]|nr:hypothetical protein [Chloroflexota bacterium]
MAQVNQDYYLGGWITPEQLPGRIDFSLAYLITEWRDLPNLADEWDEWEENSRYDFYLEWPIKEGHLHKLRQWHAQGLLSQEQCERYTELQRLIEQNTPILERLLAA